MIPHQRLGITPNVTSAFGRLRFRLVSWATHPTAHQRFSPPGNENLRSPEPPCRGFLLAALRSNPCAGVAINLSATKRSCHRQSLESSQPLRGVPPPLTRFSGRTLLQCSCWLPIALSQSMSNRTVPDCAAAKTRFMMFALGGRCPGLLFAERRALRSDPRHLMTVRMISRPVDRNHYLRPSECSLRLAETDGFCSGCRPKHQPD